jgi:CheY-like chemotaxis protein
LINDVLDIAKIEARKLELVSTSFHLPSFLQGVAEICQIRAIEKGITFEFQPDPQLPLGVYGDEKRLRQVLLNLLGNAIKFTEIGSVTLQAEVLSCQVTQEKGTVCKIRFLVADTGVGMTPTQITKIFLPFEQVGDRQKQTEGTGLGLAITQKIVTLMQSQILVESELGKGSIFQFEVELPVTSDWSQASRVVQHGLIIGYKGEKRRILVVDDRWENRAVLVNLLEPIGFEMIEANHEQAGIEQTLANIPDLIITDSAMPVMDGLQFLQQLRSYDQFKNTTVLVSSASVFEIDRYNSLAAGGTDFLSKPVRADTLLKLIQQYLQLEWIYEASSQVKTGDDLPVQTGQMQPPSEDILRQLAELIKLGDLDSIGEIAHQIRESEGAQIAFAQELIRLVDNFEVKNLRAFIQGYLT